MLIQNKPDFTAVSKISSRIAIDISKHTTFGRMDEQTWICGTEFVRYLECRIHLNTNYLDDTLNVSKWKFYFITMGFRAYLFNPIGLKWQYRNRRNLQCLIISLTYFLHQHCLSWDITFMLFFILILNSIYREFIVARGLITNSSSLISLFCGVVGYQKIQIKLDIGQNITYSFLS